MTLDGIYSIYDRKKVKCALLFSDKLREKEYKKKRTFNLSFYSFTKKIQNSQIKHKTKI